MDRVDRLLSGEPHTQASKRDRVDDLLEGITPVQTKIGGKEGTYMLQTGEEPTGEVSTITGRPAMRPVATSEYRERPSTGDFFQDINRGYVGGEQEASFGSLVESKQVDDLNTRIGIFAKNRGISTERYGVVNGRIVYQGDDGNLYFEEPNAKTIGGLAKDVAATTLGHPEEIAMGTLGAAAGPATAGLLAAGGAGIRKVRGKLMYDEPQTTLGNVGEMAVAGGTGTAGAVLGGKLVSAHDVSMGREGARLVKAAGRGRERISLPETQRMELEGQRFGIDLLPPQTTRSPELVSRFNILGDLPETADLIGAARRTQHEEVVNAIDDFLGSIAKPTSPGEAGRRGVEAAKEGMEAPYKSAQAASKNLYEQAKQIRGVDISETAGQIDTLMNGAPSGGLEKKALQRIRNMLVKKETDAEGKIIEVAEDRVSVLDKVKKEINTMWKADPKTAPEKETQRTINQVLDDMLTKVDDQVPVYGEARKVYRETIQAKGVDELKKTKVAEIAKLEGDKVERVADLLFSPTQSSPEIVAISKPMIIKYGGEDAWNALIRVRLQKALDGVKDTVTGGVTNIGGRFRKAVFGDPQQRKILQEAMSAEQFQALGDFSEVLDRTGLILGKESTTATRGIQLSRMHEEAESKLIMSATRPLYTYQRFFGDKLNEVLFTKSNERLASAMLSPKAATELQRMLQLKPKSQKLLTQFGAFLTSVSEGEFEEILERTTRRDVLPPTQQGRLSTRQRTQRGRLEWLQ